MMLVLPANVLANLVHCRLAHGKRAVSALPMETGESRPASTQPIIRTLLHLAHNITQRLCPRQDEQQMRVVGFGIDLNGRATEPVERAAHVSVEIGPNLIRQNGFSILRGEDQVNVDSGEGLRHGSRGGLKSRDMTAQGFVRQHDALGTDPRIIFPAP